MALIKCPECGKEVSDKAQACINCGCPLAGVNPSGPVSVALNGKEVVKLYIFNTETGEEIFCGCNGEVARFNVEKETEISVIDVWQKKHPEKGTKAIVRAGKNMNISGCKTFSVLNL